MSPTAALPDEPPGRVSRAIQSLGNLRSRAFSPYRARAKEYLEDPQEARRLLNSASRKAGRSKSKSIRELGERIKLSTRLVRAYVGGSYRTISKSNVVFILAALIYFVSPADLIPDVIAGVGYLDDAVVLGIVFSSLGEELDGFSEWEASQ